MSEKHEKDGLSITIAESEEKILVDWSGKSMMRKPAEFVVPILSQLLERSRESQKAILLDFRDLKYMNSSTITPIIKLLEQCRNGGTPIEVNYLKSLRWQEVSFAALRVFETEDRRVRIVGVE